MAVVAVPLIHPLMMSVNRAGPAWQSLHTLAENAAAIPAEYAASPWPSDVYRTLGEVRDRLTRRMRDDVRMAGLTSLLQFAEEREMPGLILSLKGSGVMPYAEDVLSPLQGRFVALCGGLQDFLNTCSETDETVSRGMRALFRGETARVSALLASGGADEQFAWTRIVTVYLATRVPPLFGELSAVTNGAGAIPITGELRSLFEGRLEHLEGLSGALRRQKRQIVGCDPERIALQLQWFRRTIECYPNPEAFEAFHQGLCFLGLSFPVVPEALIQPVYRGARN